MAYVRAQVRALSTSAPVISLTTDWTCQELGRGVLTRR